MRMVAQVKLNSVGKLGDLEAGQMVKGEEAVVREPDLRRLVHRNSFETVDEASYCAMECALVEEVEWEVVEVLALEAEIAANTISSKR